MKCAGFVASIVDEVKKINKRKKETPVTRWLGELMVNNISYDRIC